MRLRLSIRRTVRFPASTVSFEVLGSGTVPIGCGLEQNRYLENGDVIELEDEAIGVLRNRIEKPADWRDRTAPDAN